MPASTHATATLIEDLETLAALIAGSAAQPTFVFKHSLTCPISSAALAEYQCFVAGAGPGTTFSLLEIQNHRPLSNRLAELTGVRHESPQALLFAGGRVHWHASHHAITERALSQALASLGAS